MFSEYDSIIISLLHRVISMIITYYIDLKFYIFIKIITYLTQFPLQVIEKNGKLRYEIDTGEETKFVNPEDVARLIFSKMKGIEQKRRSFRI